MTPSRPPYLLLASLYTSQFVPLGFFFTALTAILRESGAPLEQLGVVYLLGLVTTMMDRSRPARTTHLHPQLR